MPKQEEIFGPVACITQFDSEEEVVTRVNNTRSSSYSSNIHLATIFTKGKVNDGLESLPVWARRVP